jgi:hypothetical protein
MISIHQRLHGIRLFEHPNYVEELSSYFYIPDYVFEKPGLAVANVEQPIEVAVVEIPVPRPAPAPAPTPKSKPRLQLPPDNLFWNIFIKVYGEAEFFNIGSKFMNREWEEKNMIRSYFTDKQKELQMINHKITIGNIKEMMSEYMVNTNTTLLGLIGLSVYYKMPIILVDLEKRTHLPFIPINTDREKLILIKIKGKGKAPDHYEVGDESVIKETFSLFSYTRPLSAISKYNRGELDEIAQLVKIDSHKKTKDELYKLLSQELVW